MKARPTAIVNRSLQVKFSLLIAIFLVIILAGNWLAFQQSKQILFREIETRGIWISRNLAYNAAFIEDKTVLNALLNNVIRENDILYALIVNQHGERLFSQSKTPQRLERRADDVQSVFCDTADPVIRSTMIDGQQVYDIGVRIVQNTNQCVGTVHLGLSLNTLDKELTRILLVFIMLSLSVILIGVIGYKIASHILVTPILQMAETAARISEGDLRQTITITSEDEVGVLQTALDRILLASRAIATRLKKACEQLNVASDEMLNMSEAQSSISQRQSASIHHISTTIEDIARSSERIATHSESATTIADATLQATQRIEDTFNNTTTGMQEIKAQVEKNTERVEHLGEKTAQIGNVIKIINTIADQTKLIAFNASIEAASAGEAGGRFAVVATEVRRLANTVVESLKEIKDSVSEIQAATSELILASETGIQKVNQGAVFIAETERTLQLIMEMLDQTTQSIKDISMAIQHQQHEHQQIVKEIKEIAKGAEHSVEIGQRTTVIAKELRALAEELDAAVQNFVT